MTLRGSLLSREVLPFYLSLLALLAATLACLMTGAVAGTFYTGGSLLFGK